MEIVLVLVIRVNGDLCQLLTIIGDQTFG